MSFHLIVSEPVFCLGYQEMPHVHDLYVILCLVGECYCSVYPHSCALAETHVRVLDLNLLVFELDGDEEVLGGAAAVLAPIPS